MVIEKIFDGEEAFYLVGRIGFLGGVAQFLKKSMVLLDGLVEALGQGKPIGSPLVARERIFGNVENRIGSFLDQERF